MNEQEKQTINGIAIRKLLITLTPQEETVICLYYGIGVPKHTIRNISEEFNCSTDRVRSIWKRAMRKLRQRMKFHRLSSTDWY